jgi:hypothetical protein
MILSPNSSRRHPLEPAPVEPFTRATPVPGWLRRAVPEAHDAAAPGAGTAARADGALAAGATLALLDAVVRCEAKWAGAWRQRLALAAAAMAARAAGRVEDEAALRDAFVFTRSGEGVSGSAALGPAGSLLLAWRRLATRPVADLLTARTLAAVLEEFGTAHAATAAGDLAEDVRHLATADGLLETLTDAFAAAGRHGLPGTVAAWLADALLAQRLGWTHAVPLLGTAAAIGSPPGRARSSKIASAAASHATGADRAAELLAAQARSALGAIDLFAELERRADRLIAVAPKLRAKGADAVVDRLLWEDALVASRGDGRIAGMSDRGLRRLFDRLVELGAVRELSGRPTFRIYGL